MGYYDTIQPTHRVNVLGTEYSVYMGISRGKDQALNDCDGYCDKTIRRCVVAGPDDDFDLGDFSVYEKTNLRHELIHAFLFESGMDGNSYYGNGCSDHPEQMVEWLAIQFPKILKAFMETNAL